MKELREGLKGDAEGEKDKKKQQDEERESWEKVDKIN